MADEGAPLLRLAQPRTLARKKRPPGFPPPPARQPVEHGAALQRGLEDVRRHFDDAVARLPGFATDVPYLRIEVAPGVIVTDAELASIGLVPVYRREDSILAAYSRDRDLGTFQSQLTSSDRQPLVSRRSHDRPAQGADDRRGKRLHDRPAYDAVQG